MTIPNWQIKIGPLHFTISGKRLLNIITWVIVSVIPWDMLADKLAKSGKLINHDDATEVAHALRDWLIAGLEEEQK